MKNKFYLTLAVWCMLFNTYAICSEAIKPISNQQDTKQLEEAQAKQLTEAQLREARERQLREIKEKQLREAQEKELKEVPIKRAMRIRSAIVAIVVGIAQYCECYKEDPMNVDNRTTALKVAVAMTLGGLGNYCILTYLRGAIAYDPASIW